ncbi:Conserved_hypothetical protein [Hexamita inflata]|uniref:Uncharacterized protein n=1 Tax=Hexamita inflata TaxID=28002 RepID=A0AA86TQE3_9EUKA|nr:Conserved hypothetical protein [Hexamita inflata]
MIILQIIITSKSLPQIALCKMHSKPDPETGYSTCICNDSSLVLQADGVNCKCPENTYFNNYFRSCLQCPQKTYPDVSQLFCAYSKSYYEHNYYFNLISQTFLRCTKNAESSSIVNQCKCKGGREQYLKPNNICKTCGGESTVIDGLTCSCENIKLTHFDELYNQCYPCGAQFSDSIIYKDRSTCVCAIGKVNINNVTCETCVSGSINNNQGVTNVDGCQCINTSYFWSSFNNTCNLCPFGIADSNNKCVCPCNSQPDNLNHSCICYGNYQFDGHNCIACPENFNIVNGVCRFNSSANPYYLQKECPSNSVPNKDDTNCVCDGNYFYTRSNNSCTLCPGGSTVTDNICAINQYTGIMPLVICGLHAKPDPATGNISCICNDSSMVLLSDGLNCQCQPELYFNSVDRTCLSCPILQDPVNGPQKLIPDGTQSFCICSQQSYFDLVSKYCITCPASAKTSPVSNICSCTHDNLFVRRNECDVCGRGATSTADGYSCACLYLQEDSYFDEDLNECIPCGKAFQTSLTYKDRSTCVCAIGKVNINNVTCETCVSGSINNNQGVTNVDGCQCINTSYFWSSFNNTCNLCPFGIADSNNKCVCPKNSQINDQNNGCICYGNFVFDGHYCKGSNNCPLGSTASDDSTCICRGNQYFNGQRCIPCLENSIVVNNVCVCDSQSYTAKIQNWIPICFKCPSDAIPVNRTCNCPQNQFYSSGNNTCTSCSSGKYYSVFENACLAQDMVCNQQRIINYLFINFCSDKLFLSNTFKIVGFATSQSTTVYLRLQKMQNVNIKLTQVNNRGNTFALTFGQNMLILSSQINIEGCGSKGSLLHFGSIKIIQSNVQFSFDGSGSGIVLTGHLITVIKSNLQITLTKEHFLISENAKKLTIVNTKLFGNTLKIGTMITEIKDSCISGIDKSLGVSKCE